MKQTILILAFILLSSTMAPAQSSQSKNLRGLKGIRLVVMFARADAINEADKPAILKLVEADASAKLKRARIPLLHFAGEVEGAGSPELIVYITLDKPNGFVYPIVSAMKLFQRVRLARDPSIEADVPTWDTFGIGAPKFTMEALQTTIASEIDQFINDYRAANPK
jgi:hypothetical protein